MAYIHLIFCERQRMSGEKTQDSSQELLLFWSHIDRLMYRRARGTPTSECTRQIKLLGGRRHKALWICEWVWRVQGFSAWSESLPVYPDIFKTFSSREEEASIPKMNGQRTVKEVCTNLYVKTTSWKSITDVTWSALQLQIISRFWKKITESGAIAVIYHRYQLTQAKSSTASGR